jgi:glutamate-1-semialdehyde 2,1-aminomutase
VSTATRGCRIIEAFQQANPTSARLAARARGAIPGGVTHDIRHHVPFPLYVERARGTRKRTVDGQELIDYWMGHGALLLGHAYPDIVAAVQAQMERGTHYGACHELEVRWAEQVIQAVPSAEQVRFTGTGTEATQLAIRLARAHAGRDKVLKFEGHFHGWHDYATRAVRPPYDVPTSAGVPRGTLDQVVVCPPNDLAAVRAALAGQPDIAAVILEPGGGSSGSIPTDPAFLRGLREATRDAGVVLIFDEVITGFRYAPGGAQEHFGVTPDLTTLAKILAGGLPGGAVCGRAEIMGRLGFRDDPAWNRRHKVGQAGTYNATPLAAAAGTTMLALIADGEAQRTAARLATRLREGLNQAIYRRGLRHAACAYSESSIFQVFLDPCPHREACDRSRCTLDHASLQTHPDPSLYHLLRCALVLQGVDFPPHHGWVSSLHTEEEIDRTAAAFEAALRLLQEDGVLA